jgi:hypothetical protein
MSISSSRALAHVSVLADVPELARRLVRPLPLKQLKVAFKLGM